MAQIETRVDYELTQAYLAAFLKVHAAAIAEDDVLRARCEPLRTAQREGWAALESLFHENLCLLTFLSHLQA